jgi:hypothetical protein
MRILLILIMSLLLIMVSSAKQESLTMGPYKVSFDLNTTDKYYVSHGPINHEETYGGIKYVMFTGFISSNGSSYANIEITCVDSNEIDRSLDKAKSGIKDLLQANGFHYVDIYNRVINGEPGILEVGKNYGGDVLFCASYWLLNNTCIMIQSNYPWDDGTLSLLKTIRVELVGKPPTFLED